jgi:hypothetical protein
MITGEVLDGLQLLIDANRVDPRGAGVCVAYRCRDADQTTLLVRPPAFIWRRRVMRCCRPASASKKLNLIPVLRVLGCRSLRSRHSALSNTAFCGDSEPRR